MTRPLTRQEEMAGAAFERYAREHRAIGALLADPSASREQKVQHGLRVARLWNDFMRLSRALDVEITPEMERERARLTCEAAALWATILVTGGLIGDGMVVLPALLGCASGYWAVRLFRRYAAHVRRRAGL